MLNVDIDYLAVRLETALDLINEIKKNEELMKDECQVRAEIKK